MGTYDDFARPEQACTSGIQTLPQPEGDRLCPMGEAIPVSQDRQAGPLMTDAERESAITRAARAMEHHMAEVAAINARTPHVFSDFVDASASRWMAQRARESMEKLIAGRSPEQIARMEQALGLGMPACANEARRA